MQGYIYLRNRDDSKHDPLVTAANSFRAQTYPVKTGMNHRPGNSHKILKIISILLTVRKEVPLMHYKVLLVGQTPKSILIYMSKGLIHVHGQTPVKLT